MPYLVARLRSWAAHHRAGWWTGAIVLAMLTGLTVRSAIAVEPCPATPTIGTETAEPFPRDRPGRGERGLALGRGADPLPVVAGDLVDLWGSSGDPTIGPAVDRLVVAGARVLVVDERTLTVAVTVAQVADVTGALRWDTLTATLLPEGSSLPDGPQRTPAARSVSTASPATTR